eukprot:1271631-Pyramimonas_sp.AAC.1
MRVSCARRSRGQAGRSPISPRSSAALPSLVYLIRPMMMQTVTVNSSSHGPLAEMLEAEQPPLGSRPS